MRPVSALALCSVAVFISCKTTVDLRLRNETRTTVEPRVEVLSASGARVQTLYAGLLAPNTSNVTRFKIKKGESFKVAAAIPGSCDLYKGAPTTVTGTSNPLTADVHIVSQILFLDDSQAFDKLAQSFKQVGDDIGAAPINIQNALDTRIGALLVAVPSAGNQPPRILHVVEPNVLGVKVMELKEIDYPRTNETEQVTISGTSAAKAAANFGPIAHFGVAFDTAKLYQLKWVLRGFGQVNKTEDPRRTYVYRFNALPQERKTLIKDLLTKNPQARLYYVNRMYVIERAELFTKEGQKLSSTGELAPGAIATASGAYTFENTTEQNKGYGPVVLNYWGDELRWVESSTEALKGLGGDQFKTSAATPDKIDLLIGTGFTQRFSTPFDDERLEKPTQHLQQAAQTAQAKTWESHAASTSTAEQETRLTQAELEKSQQQAQEVRAELEEMHRQLAQKDAEARQLRMQQELSRVAKTKSTDRGLIVSLSSGILFDSGKSSLKPGAKRTLERIAEELKMASSARVVVEGHTDNVGTAAKNVTLSEKRANAVRDFLVSAGVSADRITATGFGDKDAVATNKTAAGRQQNRRVELVITQ